jgi:hypothetical protein
VLSLAPHLVFTGSTVKLTFVLVELPYVLGLSTCRFVNSKQIFSNLKRANKYTRSVTKFQLTEMPNISVRSR